MTPPASVELFRSSVPAEQEGSDYINNACRLLPANDSAPLRAHPATRANAVRLPQPFAGYPNSLYRLLSSFDRALPALSAFVHLLGKLSCRRWPIARARAREAGAERQGRPSRRLKISLTHSRAAHRGCYAKVRQQRMDGIAIEKMTEIPARFIRAFFCCATSGAAPDRTLLSYFMCRLNGKEIACLQ